MNRDRRALAVEHSALWAAAGDALGWISELTDVDGLKYRTGGSERVTEPMAWKRIIGGRNGVRVDLPAGTYSDDTQLRLAVCRAIRGNGSFDVEAFAKVELPVWQSYALGGGRSTKSAASNLARRDTNWFSNFYGRSDSGYLGGGGNGAAMRIQPHVWSAVSGSDAFLTDVVRDSIITHGHPHGFVGAVIHAIHLDSALNRYAVPGPHEWLQTLDRLNDITRYFDSDPRVAAFWRPSWEQMAGVSLADAIRSAREDALRDTDKIIRRLGDRELGRYAEALTEIGGLKPETRGSGLKTAIAAAAASWIWAEYSIEDALTGAANVLGSDTDTICTMAGALLGATASTAPHWQIQDREYILEESRRLAAISQSIRNDTYGYPDLATWQAPSNQSDAVGEIDGKMALAGLGQLKPFGKEYTTGDAVWQWCELPFGQTVLAKRRLNMRPLQKNLVSSSGRRPSVAIGSHVNEMDQRLLPLSESVGSSNDPRRSGAQRSTSESTRPVSSTTLFQGMDRLDELSDEIIRSDFDTALIGRLLIDYIDSTRSIDGAIALTAIVAKARIARSRRSR